MDLKISSIDFTQFYQISSMIIGFGGLILGYITLARAIKKDKQKNNNRRKGKKT